MPRVEIIAMIWVLCPKIMDMWRLDDYKSMNDCAAHRGE